MEIKGFLAILSYIVVTSITLFGFTTNNGIPMFIGGLGSAIFLISMLWYSDKFEKWIYPIFIILTVIFIIILLAVAPNPEPIKSHEIGVSATPKYCSDFPVLVKFKPIDYTFYEDLDAEITLIDDDLFEVSNITKDSFIVDEGRTYEYEIYKDGYWTETGKIRYCFSDKAVVINATSFNISVKIENSNSSLSKNLLILLHYKEIPVVMHKIRKLDIWKDKDGCYHLHNPNYYDVPIYLEFKDVIRPDIESRVLHKTLYSNQEICLPSYTSSFEYILDERGYNRDYYIVQLNYTDYDKSLCDCIL